VATENGPAATRKIRRARRSNAHGKLNGQKVQVFDTTYAPPHTATRDIFEFTQRPSSDHGTVTIPLHFWGKQSIQQSSDLPSIPDPSSFSQHGIFDLLERPHHSVFLLLLRRLKPGLEESLSKCAMLALYLLLHFTMASVQKSVC
jgi:hypothetical protein